VIHTAFCASSPNSVIRQAGSGHAQALKKPNGPTNVEAPPDFNHVRTMQITERLFAAFVRCRYKARLIADGQTGVVCDYAQFESDLDDEYRKKSLEALVQQYGTDHIACAPPSLLDATRHSYDLIINSSVTQRNFAVGFAALEHVPGDPPIGRSRYVPLMFMHRKKLTSFDKLLVGFHALVLSLICRAQVAHGTIIHGKQAAVVKVPMTGRSGPSAVAKQVEKLTAELTTQLSESVFPPMLLNEHCGICEFRECCRAKAVESGSLTLLRGITPREVAKHDAKGIFTVTQLSYTFRQRRRPKRQKEQSNPHSFALQALALRENKVHVHGAPSLRLAGTVIYLDIEGVPDRDLY
jgi:predicted RecB family nuclease